MVSCSFATVTYKALAAADRLAAFYPDLRDPDLEAPFIIFHQRYSTNTAPTWERAQPFRMLCHNGEINTIAGNANRMDAREGRLGFAGLAEEAVFRPAFDENGSDSAILDEVAELLTKEGGEHGTGRDIRRSIAMLVPAAWEDAQDMDEERRGFYRWHASLMEPWDGPAALIFTDGVAVGRRSIATACAHFATGCPTTDSSFAPPRPASSTNRAVGSVAGRSVPAR